jgi:hypothetical protein
MDALRRSVEGSRAKGKKRAPTGAAPKKTANKTPIKKKSTASARS